MRCTAEMSGCSEGGVLQVRTVRGETSVMGSSHGIEYAMKQARSSKTSKVRGPLPGREEMTVATLTLHLGLSWPSRYPQVGEHPIVKRPDPPAPHSA